MTDQDEHSAEQMRHLQQRIVTLEMQLQHAINLRMEAQRRAYNAEKAVAEMTLERHRAAMKLAEMQRELEKANAAIHEMYQRNLTADVASPGQEPV